MTVDRLLDNKNFVTWVIEGMKEHEFWTDYKDNNPAEAETFDTAIAIIQSQKEKKKTLSDKDIEEIWNILDHEYDSEFVRRFPFRLVK